MATGALVLTLMGGTALFIDRDTQRGFAVTARAPGARTVPAAVGIYPTTSYAANKAPDLSNVMTVVDGSALDSAIWPNFQRYVAGCMKRKGYSYGAAPSYTIGYPPPATLDSADGTATTSSPTTSTVEPAMTDMEAAAAPSSVSTVNSGYLAALRGVSTTTASTDYRAYDGVTIVNAQSKAAPVGGCELEGREAVTYPALEAATRVSTDLQPLLDSTLMTPEALKVNAAWSSCMKAKGYSYASYVDPPPLFRVRADVLRDAGGTSAQWSTLQSQESATATASADCATASGVSAFIANRVQPAWTTFRSAHLTDLNLAGGMTGARGDLQ